MARPRLGDLLIEAGVLDAEQLQRALDQQRRWGGPLGRYLVEMGLIDEDVLIATLERQVGLPSVSLDPERMDPTVVAAVPQAICDRYGVIAFATDERRRFVDVAMADATNIDAIEAIRVATRFNVRPYIAGPKAVERAIEYFFHGMPPRPATRHDLVSLQDAPGVARREPPAPAQRLAAQRSAAAPAAPAAAPSAPAASAPPPADDAAPTGILLPAAAQARLAPAVPRAAGTQRSGAVAAAPPAGQRPAAGPAPAAARPRAATPPPVAAGPAVPAPRADGAAGPAGAEVAAQMAGLLDRIGAVERTLARLETVVQSLIAVLVERRAVNREELARRVAERLKGKAG